MQIKEYISKRILVIGPDYRNKLGGISIVTDTFLNYYEKTNFIPSISKGNRILNFFIYIRCLIFIVYYTLFKGVKVVHIHGASNGSFLRKMIIIYLSKILGLKIVYHMHGGGFAVFYGKWNICNIIKKTLNKVDILVVLSNSWLNYFKSLSLNTNIIKVNNIVQSVKNQESRKKRKSGNVVKLLFLGKVVEGKGVFDLLEIIKEKKDNIKGKISLTIGGNGDIIRLKEIIDKYELQELVTFKGWVSGDKKESLFFNNDIFILPSYNEGLPISILEAMSYSMPIISTNVGGIPEIVQNNMNGLLLEPGSKDSLFDAMTYFFNNPSEIERMGKNSLKIVSAYYPENVIPQLEDIYKMLLN